MLNRLKNNKYKIKNMFKINKLLDSNKNNLQKKMNL